MSAYDKVENKLVTCPYDEAHKVKQSRLQLHIAKCKLNNLEKEKEVCPFNATHRFERSERDFHLLNCPDKGTLDRKLAQSIDKNNPFKGRTDVPPYSEPTQLDYGENWDAEISDATPGYVPQGPPPGAIVEPRAMAKPAERRKLYQELHRMQIEGENDKEPAKPAYIPRQPKQPCETLKLQNDKQELNMQAVQNLGLGRGKPSRIAANIFDQSNNVNNVSQNKMSYSDVINGINNLGLGRGQDTRQGCAPAKIDEEEFPTLGCGRGAFRGPKQSPRTPGVKSLK